KADRTDERRSDHKRKQKSSEAYAAAEYGYYFRVTGHARTYIHRGDKHGDRRNEAPDPGNIIEVVACNLTAADTRLCKLVHFLREIDNRNDGQKDQHHKEESA